MKFSVLLYIHIVTFLFPLMVESKLLLSLILNGGHLPSEEGYTCDERDTEIIKEAIDADGNYGNGEDEDDEDDEDDRRLTLFPRKCKEKCKYVAVGSCHVTECKGYRRHTQEVDKRASRLSANRRLDDEDSEDSEDGGSNNRVCENGIKILSTELDGILPRLSAGCRFLVQHKRDVSCFDDVRHAAVESFNLWNADTDTIELTGIQNNTVICLTGSNLNIEAVANTCVDEMDISIRGPVSRSREINSLAPFSVFGNTGDNFSGRKLPVGSYTVQTNLDGSHTPKARLTFSVQKC